MRQTEEQIKRDVRTFYDNTAVEYHQGNYLNEGSYSPLKFRQYYIEQMIREVCLPVGARILDVGCGPGELALELSKKGYDVTGVDISSGMVEKATQTLEMAGLQSRAKIQIGDVENLAFADSSFDVVVASGVIEYQEEDAKALSEMQRVLKGDGYLILNITNRYSYVTCSESFYFWLKRQSFTKRILNLGKRKILRRGPVSDFPLRRIHSPRQFDRELKVFGFRKVKHNYFRFSPLPVPFDSLFSFICGPAGRFMERLTESSLGFIGGGYLVLCKKKA